MTQPQPSSLPHYRTRAVEVGCQLALKEAALHVDKLNDALGRRIDILSAVKMGSLVAAFFGGMFINWIIACAAIGQDKPDADWPALTRSVIYADNVSAQCGKYALMPLACAEINFRDRTCTVYTSVKWEWVLVHEFKHCDGYDHEGETSLRDAWRKYKEAK